MMKATNKEEPTPKLELLKLLRRELSISIVRKENPSVLTICKTFISRLKLKKESNTTSL